MNRTKIIGTNTHNYTVDDIPNFDDELTGIMLILETMAEYQSDLDAMIAWVQKRHPNITKERLTKLMLLK